jgi:predicted phage terminase large subunit-like protein
MEQVAEYQEQEQEQAGTLISVPISRKQAEFCHSTELERAFSAGIGSGKSWILAYDLMRRARRGRLYAVYAPSYRMLRDSTLRSFMEVGAILKYIVSYNKGDHEMVLGNGAEVLFRSLEDPETARGPNLSGAVIDEASVVKREAYPIILGRLRQGGEQGWLSSAYTPKGKKHWTYQEWGSDRPGVKHVTCSLKDNPFAPPGLYERLKAKYTTHFAAQELDGIYLEDGGAIAKRSWFRVVSASEAKGLKARGWDLAATQKKMDLERLGFDSHDPDYTAGVLMGRSSTGFYIEDVVHEQIGPQAVEPLILKTAKRDGHMTMVCGEQEPGASGKILAAQFTRKLAGYMTRWAPSTGDKIIRAMPMLSQAEAGNVFLAKGAWNDDFLDEVESFGVSGHDDQIDAAALAFSSLVNRMSKLQEIRVEIRA